MSLFSKRYFVLISLILLGFTYISFSVNGLASFLIFALILGLGYYIYNKKCKKTKNANLIFILLLCAALVGALNTSAIIYKNEYEEEKYSGYHVISGYISDIEKKEAYFTEHAIVIESVDGERAHLEMLFVTEYQSELLRGDFFEMPVYVMYREEYEGAEYMSARSEHEYPLVCVLQEDGEITYLESEFRPSLALAKLNSRLSSVLKQTIGGDEGKLASALLLGNRELLSEDTLRDFRRAGVYHMLALSGLHVSILIGLLDVILKKLSLDKRLRLVLLLGLSLFYIALTGFKLSACRSMLMLWCVYFSFFLERRSDTMTSLFLAVTLIALIDPIAVTDIGLLLSFLSTFGVIVSLEIKRRIKFFSESEAEKGARMIGLKIARYVLSLLLISLCVFVSTLPVLYIYFGEVSLATFVSNIFMGIICEAFMILSLAVLLTFAWTPVGALFASLASAVGAAMIDVVRWISDGEGIVLSLRYTGMGILVFLLFISTLVLLGIKLTERKYLIALPTAVFAVLTCALILIHQVSMGDKVVAQYLAGDSLVLSSAEGVYVCESSDGRAGALYDAVAISKENCFTEIDGIILTNYRARHPVSVESVTKRYKVRSIYLPMPQNADEDLIMRSIVRMHEGTGTEIYLYEANEPLSILGGEFIASARAYEVNRAQASLAFTFGYGEGRVTVIEGPYFGSYLDEKGDFDAHIKDSDAVIFGSVGYTPRTEFELYADTKYGAEICFPSFEFFELSDYTGYLDSRRIFFDVGYKKYVLK